MGLELGARVLDIACGTGNVTIPLARRGVVVTGLDMMPHLLEEARSRAGREGLRIRFDERFAERLPYPDSSFDVLVSMFGVRDHVFSAPRDGCFGDGACLEAWRTTGLDLALAGRLVSAVPAPAGRTAADRRLLRLR
jgi:SAM-dependent methyltransferase